MITIPISYLFFLFGLGFWLGVNAAILGTRTGGRK